MINFKSGAGTCKKYKEASLKGPLCQIWDIMIINVSNIIMNYNPVSK